MTVKISDDLVKRMDKFSEVNWSEVIRNAIKDYINARESDTPS
jgi:metal-responsive CopG/Arc/MetJ family transcriptional regulator